MAVKFKFVNAILCERVLREADGINSAIRIADIFQIPHGGPEKPIIQFYALLSVRTVPAPDVNFRVSLFMTGPSGKRERLPDPPENPFKTTPFGGDSSIPNGLTIIIQLTITVEKTGTAYLDIEVDDVPAITV